MNYMNCCLCGSVPSTKHWTSRDHITEEWFSTVQCAECGLVYVTPQPASAELHRYYPESHQVAAPAFYERMDAKPRIKFVAGLRKGEKPPRLLDVGTGKALLLSGLREQGWEVAGTELSELSRKYASEQGLKVYNCDIDAVPHAPGSIDIVTMFHSLEHLTNPQESVRHIAKLLKPGGRLVIEVPNIDSWYARLFKEEWFHYDTPRHLFHFGPRTLQRLIENAGMEMESFTTHANLNYDAFGAVQSALNRLLADKNLLNNFNTGQTTFSQLMSTGKPLRSAASLVLSQLLLAVGYPPLVALTRLLDPWVAGGTMRLVAVSKG